MPASLISAKIRGIRSYSPYPHKTQTIDFYPLTLIVGSNGSGKTTIIESLKFIIAGEEPPLSDSRRNFLNASKNPPQSFDKGTTYASIDLEFNNAKNELCLAKRQISKLDTAKSSTTPISSSFKIANGPWKHVHKQDDWNKTLPQLFNLPNQALLNHVILCHQEENLWCMGDSSTVKQIFDRIFGCEQYKKEIKHIETELKSCKTDLTLAEKDCSYLKDKVECKTKLTNQVGSLKVEIQSIKDKESQLDEKIEIANEERKKVESEVARFEHTLQTVDNLRARETELKVQSKRIQGSIGEALIDPQDVSDEEFEKMFAEHKAFMEDSRSKLIEITNRENLLTHDNKKQESLKNSIQEVINKMTVMELKSAETHETLLQRLNNLKLEQSLDAINCDDIQASIEVLERLGKDLAQNKSNKVELEDNLSQKHRKLSKSITNLEGLYQGLLHKTKSKEVFLRKLREQLARADPMTKDLILVVDNLKKVSDITHELPSSSLMSALNRLVEESTSVIERVVRQLESDSINKLNQEIKKEVDEIEDSKQKILKIEREKTDLASEQKAIEDEQVKVRAASKDAHNKAMIFASAKSDVISSYNLYCREKKLLNEKVLSKQRDDLENVIKKIESNHQELIELAVEKSSLTQKVDSGHKKNEEYGFNQQYRQVTKQLDAITVKINTLLDEYPADREKITSLKSELSDLEKKICSLRDTRSSLSGSKVQLEHNLVRTKSELKNYPDCNRKYAESLGKVVCNKMAISDLTKLKDCLQNSVTNFHVQMISKINEVLRARWRQIYKGSDIDCIELVDEEITKGKDKKAFNYYIAMRKNGLRMKMREKSSAGQRALASIILRMTLAELFVKDFTFIALDEPTANLDFDNVQSLSKAIGSFVKRRADKGVNLQWIIITHDETFLQALDSNISPYFYKIVLDHEGCSKIMKLPFADVAKSQSLSASSTQT